MSEGKDESNLDALGRKIEDAKATSPTFTKLRKEAEEKGSDKRGLNFAMRIGTELVAAILIGVGIGYALDQWLETKPLFLIIFFLFGSAAGFMNIYRVVMGIDMTVGYADTYNKAGSSKEDQKEEQEKN